MANTTTTTTEAPTPIHERFVREMLAASAPSWEIRRDIVDLSGVPAVCYGEYEDLDLAQFGADEDTTVQCRVHVTCAPDHEQDGWRSLVPTDRYKVCAVCGRSLENTVPPVRRAVTGTRVLYCCSDECQRAGGA